MRGVIVGAMLVTGLAVAVMPASAQDTRQIDLSAGYLNVNRSMHGANIQVSRPISRHWVMVGELNTSLGSDPRDDDYVYRDLAGLAGVRHQWHPSTGMSPFWQVLAGGLHSRAKGRYCYVDGRCFAEEFSVSYFALQPGVGVTVMVTPRFGIRSQADLQFAIPDQSKWEGMSVFPRVVAGAVVRLGSGR